MATTVELGRPGAHARDLALQRAKLALAWAGATLGALALFFVAGGVPAAFDQGPRAAFVWVAGGMVGFGVVRCRAALVGVTKARVGSRSERHVARVLRGCAAEAVVHGADLGRGGDADHIVLGPMVVVIETKSGRGVVRVNGDRMLVGGRTVRSDPVAQVRRQAQLLARRLRLRPTSVVCVVGMTNPAFRVDETWVCSAADLPAVVQSAPSELASGAGVLAADLAGAPPRRGRVGYGDQR